MKVWDWDIMFGKDYIKPAAQHKAPEPDDGMHSIWLQFLGVALFVAWS
jgi:hypothetical protein